ncbi:MAG: 50S ribosomal protein L13 [Candidatus Shikimatogenerans bostrichidophilus]|nr:MAG: 50S ribosomal protein L13 [Candidatus Shikimatogenerans bostrichidophilus]
MKYISFKTKYYINKININYLINAKNKILGRLCSFICNILMGKNLSTYTPNYSFYNKIIIINTEKIKINKKKIKKKIYYKYSGYIGNKKKYTMEFLFKKDPNYLVKKCIERMLPKNLLGKNLKKYIFLFKKNHNFLNKKFKIIKFNNLK